MQASLGMTIKVQLSFLCGSTLGNLLALLSLLSKLSFPATPAKNNVSICNPVYRDSSCKGLRYLGVKRTSSS